MENPNLWNQPTNNNQADEYIFWGSIFLAVLILIGLMLLIATS